MNTKLLQTGDILLTRARATDVLSDIIVTGEEYENHQELNPENQWIPDHSLFVYDKKYGAEMTWPHAGKVELCKLKRVISVLRCPYLRDDYCIDAPILRAKLKKWMDEHSTLDQIYGVLNLVAFLRVVPEDKKHCICSMWTTLALQEVVEGAGYSLSFPATWKTPDGYVGLVSPLDQLKIMSDLVWNINFI